MLDLFDTARQQVADLIDTALQTLAAQGTLPAGETPAFAVEVPADRAHGDLSCNAALVGAKLYKMNPRQLAGLIVEALDLSGTYLSRCDIAGPGFINFFLSGSYDRDVLKAVLDEGEVYGHSDVGGGEKVMVEFVSANPTGPMHLGNARGGALGDCVAEILSVTGHDVCREFYVNDAGNQIEKFGLSLEARYLQHYKGEDAVPFPEDGYHGEDITERAEEYIAQHGDALLGVDGEQRRRALIDFALPLNIARMQSDLERYRITYDNWFLESSLYESGEFDTTIALLKDKNLTYEKDGALYYRATDFGGEKDEVLIRQNGHPTYFAADIAYHINKFAKRGFACVINVWGADHHGHVARLKGAMDAVGLDGSKLDILLMQLVRLTHNGEVVRMSKRTGKALALRDLIDEVPIDAARFFFNMREASSHLEFDMALAVQQDSNNPVYYVQYAHARICSIERMLAENGVTAEMARDGDASLLTLPEEIELLRHLGTFPSELKAAAKSYDPARITRYCTETAAHFHKFYSVSRVKTDDAALTKARLALCIATRTVLGNALTILKISAPGSM